MLNCSFYFKKNDDVLHQTAHNMVLEVEYLACVVSINTVLNLSCPLHVHVSCSFSEHVYVMIPGIHRYNNIVLCYIVN